MLMKWKLKTRSVMVMYVLKCKNFYIKQRYKSLKEEKSDSFNVRQSVKSHFLNSLFEYFITFILISAFLSNSLLTLTCG